MCSAGFLAKNDFGKDGIHPTNDGYKKMLQDPEDNGTPDKSPATSP
jgi:hypothetical protein